MPDTSLIATIENLLEDGSVLDGAASSERYEVDFSGENPCRPLAVVRPATTQELARILEVCNRHNQPVVVQGGMTGLSGGATPQAGELAISLERMSGIEAVDVDSLTATVLAGTPLQAVQDMAASHGMMFPLDLGARGSCTIGGNIATNAGGNQVIRFGMMRNLVLGLEAVLADGTIVSSMNRMIKNNAGFDLKQLFIGTEGTLGIVTRAVLRLYPKMPAKTTAICAISDFTHCIALLHALQSRLGGSISAFEAMWAPYLHTVVELVAGLRNPFESEHPIYVLIETEGAHEAADRERMESTLGALLEDGTIVDAVLAQSERQAQDFWRIRDGIGDITPHLQPMLAFDVSMPISAMPEFLSEVDRKFGADFDRVRNLIFGHIGDNNLHLAVTTGREEDFPRLRDIVYEATGHQSGSVSAEHGVGTLRREHLHLSRNETEIELMRTLKAALDPKGILNPNRVIP